jgi:hypothetical protein
MNEYDDLKNMIAMIVRKEIMYAVPRLGQVLKVQDDDQKGKILVSIPSLSWTTQDTGQWCYPKDKKNIITPKIDDWVIVEWIDGNVDSNAVYSAIAYWMKDMLPKIYDGKPTTQVLFEDNKQELSIIYDEEVKELKINHDKQKYTITFKNDGCDIVIGDVNINIDKNTNSIIIDDGSNLIEIDGTSGVINLENGGGNTIEMGATSVKINNTSLEILQ